MGFVGDAACPYRCDPRPERQPGDRLHRLARPQSTGGGRPDYLPAHYQSARAAGCEGSAVFIGDVDLYFARTRVLERFNLVTKALPTGVVPTLGPDATGVGHVFWYTVEGGGKNMRDLRSLQDWFVRYQLNSVPGVAEVASIGGTVQ